MKRIGSLWIIGPFVLAMACTGIACGPNGRLNIIRPDPKPPLSSQEVPTVAALVNYLDENAQKVQTLRSNDVSLTPSGSMLAFNVPAQLVCQRPKNFRMSAINPIGRQAEVDLGSNDQEFWFWIKRAEPPQGMSVPPQFHCSYQALQEGKVRVVPFPFQPDWIMETLGMGQYGPATRYEKLQVEAEKLKLIERVRSPQGVPVRKVIVFNRRKATGTTPQITDFLLEDEATGKVICSAHVSEVQFDKNGAIFPRRLELNWPEKNMKLGMALNGVEVNLVPPQTAFVRRPMPGIPSFDLATARVDGQTNAIQRAQLLQPH